MFVDKEAVLPHTATEFQLAVARLERLAKMVVIQALHQKDGIGGQNGVFKSSKRKPRTLLHTYLEHDAASGQRKRDFLRVHHDLSGRCG